MRAITDALPATPLFGEVRDCYRDNDPLGMFLRLNQLDESFPQHPVLFYYAAKARELLGQEKAAVERYGIAARMGDTAIGEDGDSYLAFIAADSNWYLCRHFLSQHRYEAAREVFTQLLKLDLAWAGLLADERPWKHSPATSTKEST